MKRGVPDGENFVNDEDLRLEMGGNGERQPHRHPAGIAFDRRVEEGLDFGERNDLVELPQDLATGHAENRAIDEDVLAAGQFRVKTGPDLQQTAHAANDLGAPLGRMDDPREDLQQRALAGAIAANDSHHLARVYFERDVAESPEVAQRDGPVTARSRSQGPRMIFLARFSIASERRPYMAHASQAELFREAFDADGNVSHELKSDRRSRAPRGGRRSFHWQRVSTSRPGDDEDTKRRGGGTDQRPAESFQRTHQRIEHVDQPPTLGNEGCRLVHDRADKQARLDQERNDVGEIAVKRVEGCQPQSGPQAREQGE